MKKSSHWITVPDENSSKKERASLSVTGKASYFKIKNRFLNFFRNSEKNQNKIEEGDQIVAERVENKAFWGIGFLILLIFTAALLAPDELRKLVKGNLFDSLEEIQIIPEDELESSQIVPSFEETQAAFEEDEAVSEFTEEGSVSENQTPPVVQNTGGVQAQTEPVEIQIDPITSETEASVETQDENNESENLENEEGQIQEDIPEEVQTLTEPEETDSNAELLQKLAQELNALKQENESLSQELINNEEEELHNAASDTAVETNDILGQPPINTNSNFMEQFPTLNTNPAPTLNQFNPTPSPYRENMHKVNISPQQILADFNQKYEQAMQQNYSNLSANISLNNVPSTPSTGPLQGFWISILITALTLFGWKSARLFLKS